MGRRKEIIYQLGACNRFEEIWLGGFSDSHLHIYIGQIGGTNLPPFRTEQGNQRVEAMISNPHPNAMAIFCGPNDLLDPYHVHMRWRLQDKMIGRVDTKK